MTTVSEYLRNTDEEKKGAYQSAISVVAKVAKELWDNKQFVVQSDYEKELMNGKLFGTRFSADVRGKEAEDVYSLMNEHLLSRDELSRQFQELLESGSVIAIGDAVVVPHGAIVNPAKTDFAVESKPVLGLTFNMVLPEDIPDDYELEDKTNEGEADED